ncbi:hypothetical protein LMG26411_03862 [Cupriavidus numazuensis]|uniref:Uncharacterized protein n=1 Tax=Cupriavidus numazuensis TaxID=221992 RepID=A0ABM8TJU3_9BURK|nr:hypothetical protein LMG26411_03862 [Cupriavidus numazuensis]
MFRYFRALAAPESPKTARALHPTRHQCSIRLMLHRTIELHFMFGSGRAGRCANIATFLPGPGLPCMICTGKLKSLSEDEETQKHER